MFLFFIVVDLQCFRYTAIGEGNGNPLQYSCLENPRDGGAWWAAIYRVSQSQTRLKWLSSSMYTAKWFSYIYIFSFRFFHIINYYKILIVTCAISRSLLFMYSSAYLLTPNIQFIPPLLVLLKSIVHIAIYSLCCTFYRFWQMHNDVYSLV